MRSVLTKNDFHCPNGSYLLSHSVGRPFKSLAENVQNSFYGPWEGRGAEPWGAWLDAISDFRSELATLFSGDIRDFCPQINLSSSLTKLVQSHERLARKPTILMSEYDFPSMGFVLDRAPLDGATIKYIPEERDITDPNVWQEYLCSGIDLVFVSHVYSNTGQKAPVSHIINQARELNIISVVDVAQSAGVINVNLNELRPDFLIGSCVKWLCGGPGAGYLWVNPDILSECQPKDVGWFSHENPFEFDLHDFRYHDSALRFWGGTPSVTPYAIASHSIRQFNKANVHHVIKHNDDLVDYLINQIGDVVISPHEVERRSGTAIISLDHNPNLLESLKSNHIWVDQRSLGLRVSPHIYNTKQDIDLFVKHCMEVR
ncbi:aminotransferase class V-fold PLP-dependent enzyme [Vibrio sp. S4M6]|uniref:aminotransferase class V-fold PLP-dependent enzyme n=1 Tax=Vibrio sinus TaxID=2946865 RepID=UPI002029FD59|nr:aminotransferase class V-fold PLP-dependent enzyme [Vibrio sinus]MCL9783401.1 aminotransferase class V-fold PLP-dependent enzyme [Vibrio sinus]